MNLADFKPSKQFIEDDPQEVSFPCLLATVRNSEFHGVAVACKRSGECTIRLRGRNTDGISRWQRRVLDKLLKDRGLASAIEEGMTDYQTNPKWRWQGYDCIDESERSKLKRDGIAAFVTVSEIIIDEVQREVIIRFSTRVDAGISEHGAVIYLLRRKWRFDYEDYLGRYHARLYKESPALLRLHRQRLKKEYINWLNSDRSSSMAEIMEYLKIKRPRLRRKISGAHR